MALARENTAQKRRTTPRGFKPPQAEPSGFRAHLLSRSGAVSRRRGLVFHCFAPVPRPTLFAIFPRKTSQKSSFFYFTRFVMEISRKRWAGAWWATGGKQWRASGAPVKNDWKSDCGGGAGCRAKASLHARGAVSLQSHIYICCEGRAGCASPRGFVPWGAPGASCAKPSLRARLGPRPEKVAQVLAL